MRKLTFLLALFFVAATMFAQDGWTKVNSDLLTGKGVGQISIGLNDNTAMWGMAINADGTIYDAFTRSVDGGDTWEAGSFDNGNGLSQLFAFDADVCWAVFNTGSNQGLYKTEDGGETWTKKGTAYGSGSFANVLHFFDDNNGFAQGDPVDGYYELYTTSDGGETWNRVPAEDIPDPLSGEYGITGNYTAVGDNIWWGTNMGRIFRSTDKGMTWAVSETTFGATETVNNIMFDAMNGLAYRSYLNLGTEEVFNVTTDGGVTWTDMFPAGVNFARYLYHVPGTENTIIGSSGSASDSGMGISISEDGGETWEIITEGYSFLASAWLDMETGWAGTETTATRAVGGMYIYGNPPAPSNVMAEVDVLDVMLSWDAPSGGGGGTTEELIYDNGTTTGAYSYEGFTMATHMSPSGPCKVLTLRFYTTTDPGDNTYNPTLFEWGDSEPDTEIVFQTSATAVESDWMDIDVSSENIMFDGDFVVGFGSINGTTFLGYDGDLDNGRSWDFDNAGESWSSWNEAYLIRAIVEYEDGSREELGTGASGSQKPIIAKGFAKVSHPRISTDVETVTPIANRSVSSLDLLGYNVWRDGNKVNADLVEGEMYTDEDVPLGSVEYYVTAVYTGGESDPSDTATVVITSVFESNETVVNIYPNPATDVLNIEATAQVQTMTIMNIAGQMVYQGALGQGTTRIDISDYQSGVYFVRLESDGEKITRKIVVE